MFQENSFPGLGSVGKKTQQDWEVWEKSVERSRTTPTTSSPESSASPLLDIRLSDRMDRTLEASIHNPDHIRDPSDTSMLEGPTNEEGPDIEAATTPEQPISPTPSSPPTPLPSPSPLPMPPIPDDVPRRGTRTRTQTNRYGFLAQALLLKSESSNGTTYPVIRAMLASPDPKTFREATGGLDKEAWLTAMNSEMESLLLNKVFDLVPLPKGKKAIGCRWHYRTKASEDGKPGRKKARLVAKGYLQRQGIDYQETYAPSTRHETIRLVL